LSEVLLRDPEIINRVMVDVRLGGMRSKRLRGKPRIWTA
jgi:hypothetical protein